MPERAPTGVGDAQLELDLLADGRDVVERWCASPRHRFLYPEGPNLAIVFEAYQELDRKRVLGRVRERPRVLRRALRRLVRTLAQRDALARDRRLRWRYPPPRVRPPHVRPVLVQRALSRVDPDARRLVQARLDGDWALPDPGSSLVGEAIKEQRGLDQFREALVNEALAHPRLLTALHPQFLLFAASALPQVRRYPLATFFLVKLPLRLLSMVVTLLCATYLGAYLFFNDERLGEFVSDNVSGLVEGDLRMAKIHWELPLILDLVTGQPTHVVVEDVSVWEAYKSYGGEPKRRTAWARHLEAELVLHEVIPWNRLGVPEPIEIPWVLHFTDVRSDDDSWFVVREYDDTNDDGTTKTLMSLLDAFVPVEPSDPDQRGISFRIDQAHLARSTLDVDFLHGIEGWRVATELRDLTFTLRFDAPTPAQGQGLKLPLRFDMDALASHGSFTLDDIEVPFTDMQLTQLACGTDDAPLGDVRFAGEGIAAGSPLQLQGVLADAFTRLPGAIEPLPLDASVTWGEAATVQLQAGSTEPHELAGHLELQLGLASGTIAAEDGVVWARVEGPMSEPRYHLAAEGLSLDLLGEPAWTFDDVQLSVTIENGPVPERWIDRFPDDSRRLVAHFDTFRGAALDGDFALDNQGPGGDDDGALVVFPEEGEPFLIAAPLALDGIDPAQLSPDDPELAATLAGQATGRVDLHQLVLGPLPPELRPEPTADAPVAPTEDETSLLLAELRLADVRVVRDRGPAVDGYPRRLRADGTVTIGPDGAIDLDDLELRTDGTELDVTGGIDGELRVLASTQLRLHVDDGKAFARAFDLPPYFDSLTAAMTVQGSTGAPNGTGGDLTVAGVGAQGGKPTHATMSMSRGVLHVHAPSANLFGGTGSIDADVALFEGGRPTDDPRLRATIELHGVELASLVGEGLSGKAHATISLGTADGEATPLSRLQVRGQATVPDLRFGGTRYRNATVKFSLGPEAVVIDELVLPVHRSLSPFHAPNETMQIGEIVARGSVGLQDDPELDLDVEARGVPLRLVARLLDADVPVRGRIDDGTQLSVRGSLRRPSVAGTVQLQGLSAEGIALGSGQLEVTSEDMPAEGPLAAHRELRVGGELATPETGDGGIAWTVDAVVALGEVPRVRGRSASVPPFDAEVEVRFNRISLTTLLRGLTRGTGDTPTITGRLDQLRAHVITCDPHASMISACRPGSRDEQSLEISLQMGRAWVGGREPTTTDPCQDATILCAPERIGDLDNRLQATIDWPRIVLDRPWRWQTGGPDPAQLELSGQLDLSSPSEPAPTRTARNDCTPPPAPRGPRVGPRPDGPRPDGPRPDGPRHPHGDPDAARAQVHGAVDLAVLAELLGADALRRARGRIDVDLTLLGPAAQATLSGRVTLPDDGSGGSEGLVLDLGDRGIPVEVSDLDLRIDDYWLLANGQIQVMGEPLRFGTVGSDHTGFAFGGACEGHWGVAVDGTLGSSILNELVGETIAQRGGVELSRVVARGQIDAEDPLEYAEGSIRFGRTSLELELDDGLPTVELTAGHLDVARCRGGNCPSAVPDGSLALYVGGIQGARSEQRQGDALRAKIGPRGTAFAWGTAYLAPDFSHLEETRVFLELEDVPYRGYDQRGRPVYEAELTSPAISFQGGTPLVVSGAVDVDRARYVQDAVQGVEMLRFTDDVELPSAPPPEMIRDLQFDLRVQTRSPLRVENNVAHGVEADAVVEVTGTYDTPEFTGRVDVEPGGTVDIPFLTGTYEIQRGRVTLLRELADAEVDVLALRRELVYIDDQPRQVYLLLGGTAEAITWQCIAEGDTSGAVETQRGCLDYLVLGAGDVQSSTLAVQRTGGGGLANARKPLQVVGHVTEFDFGKRIEEAAPRLSPYVPDIKLRLGQIGPELEVTTPQEWLDFDWAHGTAGLDYTRGYPGFLLQQSRELTFELEAIDMLIFEVSRDIRSYLNNRIIFDPLQQTTVEFRVDFEIPSLR
ncbi:translocation/assembly module TamB domain-containing protein [Paraliomyxa miuraensis]|uniref:translocation/assembly module TamB domain-containing protein n=1 Tax=Paraliomyxa miuraensis TaxID=376150 RepID=UPI002253261A|nr:translocation/assembly module TamB domain-containing protein [Paraliomyxa miuraensis]MCX4244399.1 translocation/assembly module TamB domain-containing protein [Paraliomyxa miuraensis]